MECLSPFIEEYDAMISTKLQSMVPRQVVLPGLQTCPGKLGILGLWHQGISAKFMVTKDDEDVVCINSHYLPDELLEFLLGASVGVVTEADDEVEVPLWWRKLETVGIRDHKNPRSTEY